MSIAMHSGFPNRNDQQIKPEKQRFPDIKGLLLNLSNNNL